jgi:hypothetical protein
MTISWTTRKNVIDWLRAEHVEWYGRLEEIDFLDRLFDLDQLPSEDPRFKSARADIWQHRINNDDWENDWVYTDSRFGILLGADETLLRFLCEMLHPIVRPDVAAARQLAAQLNDLLKSDGVELLESTKIGDHPVWVARSRSLAGVQALSAVRHARAAFDEDYISQQITRMESAVESDPALAIGSSKELVETTVKAILMARKVPIATRIDLPKLVRLASSELGLVPEGIANEAKAAETVRRVLGSLSVLIGGIDDLRNDYGTGHGRIPGRGLLPRHAKLVVGSASALAVFLWETHLARPTAKPDVSRG